ncbi:MAG: choice-of-anchor B family protein [Phycisphaerales bacterium]
MNTVIRDRRPLNLGRIGASFLLATLGLAEARAGFPSENVELMSHIPLSGFPSNPSNGNDCWGYVSASGREYALMGVRNAMVVVEITDPFNPVIVQSISHTSGLWGDVKVYGEYCYVVNEAGGGMDVIDLSNVDSGVVTLVQRFTGGVLSASHNVAIDEDSGFAYLCGANFNGGRIVAIDLADPENPVIAGQISSAQGAGVHDAQAVTYTKGPFAGREIIFAAVGGTGLDIYDVTDKSNMFRMSRTTYPNLSYAHQCWASEDRQYLYLNDETDGVNETVIFDISDLDDPVVAGTYNSGVAATDHNLYVHDGFIYEAEYRAGLRIFDASDPLAPVQVGWFDTFPANDNSGFDGAWSVYPFFPSGIVIISDMNAGLFVVDPGTPPIAFEYPGGLPDIIDPSGDSFLVQIIEQDGGQLDPDSSTLHYDDGGGFVDAPMTPLGKNLFEAVFGSTICAETVSFYVSAATIDREVLTDPPNAPASTFSALSAIDVLIIVEDDMEADTGWVVGAAGDDATTGVWTRVNPNGTAAQPEDDHTPNPGTMCFVTGQGPPGGAVGENDVDNGQTTLISPLFDLADKADAIISYWRWYSNDQGNSPNADIFVIDISNDNGSTWSNVEIVGPDEPESGGGWFQHSFSVSDFVEPTSEVRLRFIAADEGDGSIVEAAVDDLQVSTIVCDEPVIGDLDGDGHVGASDLLILLANWGPCGDCKDCPADLDGNCTVGASDLLLLLANWG